MIDAVVVAGLGFKAPTSESFRTYLLLESVEDVMLVLSEFRSSWVETGCTIMSDGWTDQRNRTLINFLVSCPTSFSNQWMHQTRLRLPNLFVK